MMRRRAREVGLLIGSGTPGPRNAITDVSGVLVGHTTRIAGKGKLVPGKGPIRTGVTAIRPHEGNLFTQPLVGTVHVINGFGKAVGLAQLLELGQLESPILLTSTMNVGLVEDAVTQYLIAQNPQAGITAPTPNPVVAECHDGYLNDAQGRHVRQQHVYDAIDSAGTDVEEGCVGAGTGIMAFGYKSGIGTASRVLEKKHGDYALGVLVVPNCGRKGDLVLGGIPINQLLEMNHPNPDTSSLTSEGGSIVVIFATDAPLTSRQLARIARRAVIGIGRTGSVVSHGSGDFVIAFSTAHRRSPYERHSMVQREQLKDAQLTPLFAVAIEATEEAILNALCMATNMTGRDDHTAEALPIDRIAQYFE
jgi:D-aminopeptidase